MRRKGHCIRLLRSVFLMDSCVRTCRNGMRTKYQSERAIMMGIVLCVINQVSVYLDGFSGWLVCFYVADGHLISWLNRKRRERGRKFRSNEVLIELLDDAKARFNYIAKDAFITGLLCCVYLPNMAIIRNVSLDKRLGLWCRIIAAVEIY